MIAFAYWMLKPSEHVDTKVYGIDFDESVLGLNLDAPVKYKGISVGKVTSISINEKNAQQVRVLVSILKSTPIKSDTVAKLTAQGITGLSYINLSMGSNSAPILEKEENAKYPIIKTAPSFLTNIEESFSSVSTRLSSTLGRTEELLGEENQEQLSALLKKSASFMDKMDKLLDDKTIAHIQSSAKNLDEFSQKLNTVLPNVERFIVKSEEWEDKISNSFNSIMTSYLGIKASMNEIKRAVSSGEFNIKEISAEIVPTMNATFLDMQELMIKFESALEEYKESPSDLLYKTQEIKKAPGE
ncbi:MAG: MCE family protein [Campylobacterales bacterium]|nr:MCE family protein [Campylobacterales bacterium]